MRGSSPSLARAAADSSASPKLPTVSTRPRSLRLRAGPDAALRDRVDLLRRRLARLRDLGREVDGRSWSTLRLDHARRGAGRAAGAGRRRCAARSSPTPSGWTPSLASVWSTFGSSANTPIEPVIVAGVGDDLVGRGRDPVAARRREVAHRDDDRLAGGARQLELAADQLGAEHAAAGRVDAQHHRLDVLVVARLPDQVGGRQAADRAGRRACRRRSRPRRRRRRSRRR